MGAICEIGREMSGRGGGCQRELSGGGGCREEMLERGGMFGEKM